VVRMRGNAGNRLLVPEENRFRLHSQEENHMMLLLSRAGLRYNENAIAPGAQTERPGLAWAGEGSACGETSPADFLRNVWRTSNPPVHTPHRDALEIRPFFFRCPPRGRRVACGNLLLSAAVQDRGPSSHVPRL